ncbi:MAG: HAMP domain-containing histidine kinase [Anaerolineae bacterium]|nr:HAMP domain-containing histidine kinase [Anaerolineae bacterium]NUQ04051.1 HAMP domain-containing protein [Anaerolineae bacterium]
MTIRVRLTLLYSGLLAIIIIVFGVLVFAVNRWVLVSSVDSTLADTADQIWKNSRTEEIREFGDVSQIVIFLPRDLDFFAASAVVVQVWGLDSDTPRLLWASSDLGAYSAPLDAGSLQGAMDGTLPVVGGVGSYYNTVRVNSGDWRVLTLPYEVRGWRIAIQAATSFEAVNAASSGLLVIMVVTISTALVGSMIIGMMLTNRVLKPIQDITQAAAQITAADDLKTRLTWTGPNDELGQLVSVFNATMGRLEDLFSVQQRFVADVSHELRTPLTAIRGHFDLIKRYGMDPDSLEAIETEISRMSRLVTDLLMLARADYGGLPLNKQPVDLDVLVEETVREARMLASARVLRIGIGEFTPVQVQGDPDRLKQLMLNLVGNAIKFTPDGGRITLNLGRTATQAVIEVEDTGIGIAPEDLKRIFDRFYQADDSRARETGEGAGLGLSIAHWIVEAHGGRIEVGSKPNQGSKFTVFIPHAESALENIHSAVTRPRLAILRRGGQSQGVPGGGTPALKP